MCRPITPFPKTSDLSDEETELFKICKYVTSKNNVTLPSQDQDTHQRHDVTDTIPEESCSIATTSSKRSDNNWEDESQEKIPLDLYKDLQDLNYDTRKITPDIMKTAV